MKSIVLPNGRCEYTFIGTITSIYLYRGMNEKKRRENAFREWYRRLGELRALFPSGVPILCLTATATLQTRKKISKTLFLANVKVIELNPDRPEIRYVVQKVSDEADETFSWVIKSLKALGVQADRVIITAEALKTAALYMMHFVLVSLVLHPSCPQVVNEYRKIDFMQCTTVQQKTRIRSLFTRPWLREMAHVE